jgi:hypothetical protein
MRTYVVVVVFASFGWLGCMFFLECIQGRTPGENTCIQHQQRLKQQFPNYNKILTPDDSHIGQNM